VTRLRDFFGAIGDRVMVDGGDLVRRIGYALIWPFERLAWGVQRWIVWPIQDRLAVRLLAICVVLGGLAAGAVAALPLLESEQPAVSAAVAPSAPESPLARVVEPEPEPTLQGASPVFEPSGKDERRSKGSAKEAEPAPAAPTADTSSVATDTISSAPAANAAKAPAVPAAPAGPGAIAVAREFADAFVVYETGGVEPAVRETFGKTATRQLSRALLRRPPRLPANVEVPEAKVVNVVAGPSRGQVFPVSVSLLRLGVTSELRLSMEQHENDGWRVADVLG
jgi:hypothetical protein